MSGKYDSARVQINEILPFNVFLSLRQNYSPLKTQRTKTNIEINQKTPNPRSFSSSILEKFCSSTSFHSRPFFPRPITIVFFSDVQRLETRQFFTPVKALVSYSSLLHWNFEFLCTLSVFHHFWGIPFTGRTSTCAHVLENLFVQSRFLFRCICSFHPGRKSSFPGKLQIFVRFLWVSSNSFPKKFGITSLRVYSGGHLWVQWHLAIYPFQLETLISREIFSRLFCSSATFALSFSSL